MAVRRWDDYHCSSPVRHLQCSSSVEYRLLAERSTTYSTLLRRDMGKKSKRKPAAAAEARPSAGISSTSSGGGGGDAGKRIVQKCANCLSSVKDISKGRQCPGCSVLYCWRCERKYFVACNNGADCIHPLRRCMGCAQCGTIRKVLGEKTCDSAACMEEGEDGNFWVTDSSLDAFEECIRTDDRLTAHANPFMYCEASGCKANECMLCLSDPVTRTLIACSRCDKTRCLDCALASLDQPLIRAVFSQARLEGSWERLWRTAPDTFWKCRVCGDKCCAECIGSSDIKGSAGFILDGDGKARYKCSRCYFAAKPCTNPTCPHEVGVPTKRCGDCRRARYCSKECQSAAYPAHQRECKAVALAASMKECEKKGKKKADKEKERQCKTLAALKEANAASETEEARLLKILTSLTETNNEAERRQRVFEGKGLTAAKQEEAFRTQLLDVKKGLADLHQRTATCQANIDDLEKGLESLSEEHARLQTEEKKYREIAATEKKGMEQHAAQIRVFQHGAHSVTLEALRTGCGFHDFPTLALMRRGHEYSE